MYIVEHISNLLHNQLANQVFPNNCKTLLKTLSSEIICS